MTTAEIPVRMWCWPGPRAAAGFHLTEPGEPVLAVFLDPVNLILTVPPFPNGHLATARFLRELARAALQMATAIDPPAVDHPSDRPPGAHRASEQTGRRSDRREWE